MFFLLYLAVVGIAVLACFLGIIQLRVFLVVLVFGAFMATWVSYLR